MQMSPHNHSSLLPCHLHSIYNVAFVSIWMSFFWPICPFVCKYYSDPTLFNHFKTILLKSPSPLFVSFQMPRTTLIQLIATAIILLALLLRIRGSHACKISEFPCRAGALCLPLDKYCDGRDDCGDASDEPKYCTGNSIYYLVPGAAAQRLLFVPIPMAWPWFVGQGSFVCWWWSPIIVLPTVLFIEMRPIIRAIASIRGTLNYADRNHGSLSVVEEI